MIARLRAGARRAGALLLLPLSAVPLLLLVPGLVDSHARFERRFQAAPYPAPAVVLDAGALRRYTTVPAYAGAVPVLVYHGIDDANDHYSVSREEFARQLEMLDRSGYRTISIGQYLRFRSGDGAGLPERPILITFDDGRLDSYRGADRVLERHRMRAVMYVITGPVRSGNPFHLTWQELHAMRASGRWDVQPHGRDGHRQVVTSPAGDAAPFYANRRYTLTGGRESFADYTARVAREVYALKDDFREQGMPSPTFAVPFGDHGQHGTAAVRRFLDELLATQFRVVFVQREGNDPGYTRPSGPAERYEVHTETTTDELRDWLVRHDPGRGA